MMRSRLRFAHALMGLTVLVVAGCGSSPEPRGQKIPLLLKLAKGDNRKIAVSMDMDMRMSGQGQKANIGMTMGLDIGLKVLNVDAAGNHAVEFSYDRLTMKMTGAPQVIDFDSAKPDNGDLFQKIMRTMIGHKMTGTVTPTGEGKDVAGVKELVEKMIAAAPGAGAAEMEKQLKGLESSFDQFFAFQPKAPVDIRDTWKSSIKMESNPAMPLVWELQNTLYDRKDGKAIIQVKGQLRGSGGEGSMTGSMSGTVTLDEKTGFNERGDFDLDMSGKIQGLDLTATGKLKMRGE